MSVLLYSVDPELVGAIKQHLTAAHIPCVDLPTAQADRGAPQPEIVIVDEAALETLGQPALPGIESASLIFLQRSLDARRTCQALRDGYAAVILVTEELHMLADTITRTKRFHAGDPAARLARTVVLYSGCGGAGRTTIAAHLMAALATSGLRTLGIDLNTQAGSLRCLFGDHGSQSVMDLMPVLDELNASHLRNAVTSLRPNLDLLGAPTGGVCTALDEAAVGQLLAGCATAYDVLVVDAPTIIDQSTAALLGYASDVIYILNPDPTGMWALGAALGQWDRWELPRNRLRIVINHRSPSLVSVDLSRKEGIVPFPVLTRIPFDPGASFSEVMKVWDRPAAVAGLAGDVANLAKRIMQPDAAGEGVGRGLMERLNSMVSGALRRAPATRGG